MRPLSGEQKRPGFHPYVDTGRCPGVPDDAQLTFKPTSLVLRRHGSSQGLVMHIPSPHCISPSVKRPHRREILNLSAASALNPKREIVWVLRLGFPPRILTAIVAEERNNIPSLPEKRSPAPETGYQVTIALVYYFHDQSFPKFRLRSLNRIAFSLTWYFRANS